MQRESKIIHMNLAKLQKIIHKKFKNSSIYCLCACVITTSTNPLEWCSNVCNTPHLHFVSYIYIYINTETHIHCFQFFFNACLLLILIIFSNVAKHFKLIYCIIFSCNKFVFRYTALLNCLFQIFLSTSTKPLNSEISLLTTYFPLPTEPF